MAGSGDPDEANGDGTPPLRRYANHLEMEFGLSEVEFRFGQRFDTQVVVHSWLVTSPVHLVGFARSMQAAITQYESLFGRIPDAADIQRTRQ